MKINHLFSALLTVLLFHFFGLITAIADTIMLPNDHMISGLIVQTNGDDMLVLTPYAAFNFSKASIKGVNADSSGSPKTINTNRLSDFQATVLLLSQQPWATNMAPIPATVIDRGILRHVPYASLRCGQDYEVNVYGDLTNPAGIEIGVYRKLLDDESAKENCINFVSNLLGQVSDKDMMLSLDLQKDLKTRDGLTFEITPPTADDSYGGWWVSIYSEEKLNLARASDDEMNLISMTQADIEKDVRNSTNFTSWSANDLNQARSAHVATITFTNSSGAVISNAEVVRVIDGVSLIWRTGATSSGMVKLSDLPENLRNEFGYDKTKAEAADELAKVNKAKWQQQVQAATLAAQDTASQADFSGDYSSDGSSGGRSVYVHGYYRKNGTYVNSYTRSYPRR